MSSLIDLPLNIRKAWDAAEKGVLTASLKWSAVLFLNEINIFGIHLSNQFLVFLVKTLYEQGTLEKCCAGSVLSMITPCIQASKEKAFLKTDGGGIASKKACLLLNMGVPSTGLQMENGIPSHRLDAFDPLGEPFSLPPSFEKVILLEKSPPPPPDFLKMVPTGGIRRCL